MRMRVLGDGGQRVVEQAARQEGQQTEAAGSEAERAFRVEQRQYRPLTSLSPSRHLSRSCSSVSAKAGSRLAAASD